MGGGAFPNARVPVAVPDRERFDALLRMREAQAELADGLVHLHPYPLAEVGEALHALARELLRGHAPRWEEILGGLPGGSRVGSVSVEVLRREHTIFPQSIEQLGWFFDVVVREDHGGHRQALGQYWRLVLESLGRHLGDERSAVERATAP
jgi:hypothetical protein